MGFLKRYIWFIMFVSMFLMFVFSISEKAFWQWIIGIALFIAVYFISGGVRAKGHGDDDPSGNDNVKRKLHDYM